MYTPMAVIDPLRKSVLSRNDLADFRTSSVLATVPGGHPTHLAGSFIF